MPVQLLMLCPSGAAQKCLADRYARKRNESCHRNTLTKYARNCGRISCSGRKRPFFLANQPNYLRLRVAFFLVFRLAFLLAFFLVFFLVFFLAFFFTVRFFFLAVFFLAFFLAFFFTVRFFFLAAFFLVFFLAFFLVAFFLVFFFTVRFFFLAVFFFAARFFGAAFFLRVTLLFLAVFRFVAFLRDFFFVAIFYLRVGYPALSIYNKVKKSSNLGEPVYAFVNRRDENCNDGRRAFQSARSFLLIVSSDQIIDDGIIWSITSFGKSVKNQITCRIAPDKKLSWLVECFSRCGCVSVIRDSFYRRSAHY